MAKFDSPLNNLKVASPCSQDWNAMIGNDRKRYCGECKLNVFNLSGMSKQEAENLIMKSEGRLCVRFYQRTDGSIITQNCPVGWAKVKQRTKVYVSALASLVFSFFGALGLVSFFNKTNGKVMGEISISTLTPKNTPEILMGTPVPISENYTTTTGAVSPRRDRTVEATVGRVQIRNSSKK